MILRRHALPAAAGISSVMMLVMPLAALLAPAPGAWAHFVGATQEVEGGFQVVFQPYPGDPLVAGANSTLNFSVLYNDSNVYNVHSAVTVAEKGSGQVVLQDPYRFYEASDITVPHRFERAGDYEVTLSTRIAGHERYQAEPLVATFELSVSDSAVGFDGLMMYYVTPAAVAAAGIAAYLHSRRRL